MVSVVALAIASSRAQAERYTLSELLHKVATEAPNVVAARENVESAQASLRAAQLGWLPTGDLTLFFTGSSRVLCNPLPYTNNNPADPTNDPNHVAMLPQPEREANCLRTTVVALNQGSLAELAPIYGALLRLDVNVYQELYSFGRLESNINIARAGVESARANLEKEQADAAWQATRTYWGIKAARAAIDTLKDGRSKLQEWIDSIDSQLSGKDVQRYTETDLIRLKVAAAFAKNQLVDQQRNLDYATEALKLMTADPDAQLDDSELDLVDSGEEVNLQTWLDRAKKSRPELHQLRANDASAHATRSARLSDLLPDWSFNGWLGAGYASSMDSPQNYYLNRTRFVNATFGLVLKQPLDLGVRAERWLQAKHDDEATRARSRASMVGFETEISKAFADWQEARGRAKETSRGEKISRGWYTAVDANINAGLYADGREMVEVLQNYFIFRLRNFQAIYDANVALAWLQRTTGTTIFSK